MYGVTTWGKSNCNARIAQYLKTERQSDMKFRQLIEFSMRNFFLENLYTKCGGKLFPNLFPKSQNSLSISFDQ